MAGNYSQNEASFGEYYPERFKGEFTDEILLYRKWIIYIANFKPPCLPQQLLG
ncbi:MAG: hypothetical protein NT178_03855 [Proteobacteria bacterium]|nr:hypothetical protein [Pseudomonadota bacterium]